MIYLIQSYPDKSTVVLQVEGDLESESLPVLEDVYRKSLESGKGIAINLEKISSVDRAGKDFLNEIQDAVEFIGMPQYIQMEIANR